MVFFVSFLELLAMIFSTLQWDDILHSSPGEFLGEASLQETTHMSEQTLAYSTRTKADGKGHGLGPPHICAHSGLLISLGKRRDSVGARKAETLGN